jgi:ribosomal protein S18 acetylase RimI-like enzyme
MHIREATPSDTDAIADFNARMALETGDPPLVPETILAGVSAILSDTTKGRYWVADVDGQVAGQICVTYEWSDWRNGMQWWIQSVYVHPDHRRKGVFSDLYRHVESLARADEQVCGLRLYVRSDNDRAKNTYVTLGMTAMGYEVMGQKF